jgi:hypothetical protein
MGVTIVEGQPGITGGVDTHLDTHVAAALDPLGRLVGTQSFPADPAGYQSRLAWLQEFGLWQYWVYSERGQGDGFIARRSPPSG